MSPAMIGGIVGGVIGGLSVLLIPFFQQPKQCPECANPLPKFRKPENSHQRMWGGWTCANCSCEIDRKGNKRLA